MVVAIICSDILTCFSRVHRIHDFKPNPMLPFDAASLVKLHFAATEIHFPQGDHCIDMQVCLVLLKYSILCCKQYINATMYCLHVMLTMLCVIVFKRFCFSISCVFGMALRSAKAMAAELQAAKDVQMQWKKIKREANGIIKADSDAGLLKAMGLPFQIRLLHVYALTRCWDKCFHFCVYAASNWNGKCGQQFVPDQDVERYIHQHGTVEVLQKCIANKDSKFHFGIARWLAEFEVLVELCRLNAKGVSPPGHHLISTFIKSFPTDSKGAVATQYMSDLLSLKWKKDLWLNQLRKHWLLTFRTLPSRPPLTPSMITAKAAGSLLINRVSVTFCETNFGIQNVWV